jgi:outer membrane protein assembly factor BamB
MTGTPDSPEEGQEAQGREAQDESRQSRSAMPRWARAGGDPSGRMEWRDWRTLLRRRLAWPAVVIVVVFAVWSNYPFIPNPWVALFGQPDGDATAASSPSRWAMYGADARLTNFIDSIPEATAPQGIIAYSVEVNGGVRSAPAVAEGTVYVGGQSRIAAYDAETGEMIWERPVSGPAHGTPAVAGDLVYLGMLGKQVLALDPGSGRIAWEYQGDSPFPGTVTVHDGIIYAPSRGGHVHALDARTGGLLWKVDTGNPVVAPVAVADGRMFAASTSGLLYIRHSRTGDKRARIRTGGALVAHPVVDGEQVYLLFEGDLLAFNTTVREMPGRYPAELIWAQLWLWRFPLPPPPEHSGLLWRVTPGEGLGAFAHPPAITPEALYLGTDAGEVVALDRESGGVLWRMQAGPPIAAPLVAAGDLLLLAHEDGSIRAIDRFSREEAWALSLGSPPAAPLSYADGTVYAHTQDGRLYAIR